jgi:hypothetical protein
VAVLKLSPSSLQTHHHYNLVILEAKGFEDLVLFNAKTHEILGCFASKDDEKEG